MTGDLERDYAALLPACVLNSKDEIRPVSAVAPDLEEESRVMKLQIGDYEIANYLKCKLLAKPSGRLEDGTAALKLRFDSAVVPLISIEMYLKRLRLFYCSKECLVLAVIYLDRLNQLQSANNARFQISRVNIHRLLLVALTLATKYFDDIYYTNDYYAKIGGIPTAELNYLEVYFLHLVKYDLYVPPSDYMHYVQQLTEASPEVTLTVARAEPEVVSPSLCLNWAKQVMCQEECSTDDDDDHGDGGGDSEVEAVAKEVAAA